MRTIGLTFPSCETPNQKPKKQTEKQKPKKIREGG